MKYLHGWWVVKTNISSVDDINWCCEQYGEPFEPSSNGRWFYSKVQHNFYFKREEDAMWFTLRWS